MHAAHRPVISVCALQCDLLEGVLGPQPSGCPIQLGVDRSKRAKNGGAKDLWHKTPQRFGAIEPAIAAIAGEDFVAGVSGEGHSDIAPSQATDLPSRD